MERVIYDRYRVTVIGCVPIKTRMTETQEIEIRKLEFCLRGEIDKTTLHKTKPRKKFAEDGRMDDGRNRQLFRQQLRCMHFPPLPQTIPLQSNYPPSICPFSLGQHFAFARGGVSRPLYVSETVRPRPMGMPTLSQKERGGLSKYGCP